MDKPCGGDRKDASFTRLGLLDLIQLMLLLGHIS